MQKPQSFNLPLGYLRAAIVLLVVAHHASLAYFPKRPPVAVSLMHNPRWWQAFPVVDRVSWGGFLPFVLFNDVFFMALLYFVSGLFVWRSLERKGAAPFLRERLVRLGIPFVFFSAAGPLLYGPAYLQSRTHDGFWHEWLGLGTWPAGAIWFVGLLLVFDFLAAGIFVLLRKPFAELGRRFAAVRSPALAAGILFLLTGASYVPMALHFNIYDVFIWGPFYVQKVRAFLYLVYFLGGVLVGVGGLQETIFSQAGALARRWPAWVAASPAGFLLLTGCNYLSHRFWAPYAWSVAIDLAFSLSCVLTCFAFLALFLHFVRKARPTLDSLMACSYGIYLVHSFAVFWGQYALLRLHVPAVFKASLVLCGSVLLSWGVTLAARRSRLVARVI